MLPDAVRERIGQEWLNGINAGYTVAEISHRGCDFMDMVEACEIRLRRLLGLSEQQQVLFMQGGATMQFTMLPMNFGAGGYLLGGHWSRKAYRVACEVNAGTAMFGQAEANGSFLPIEQSARHLRYLHLTSNETIHGICWPSLPLWLKGFNRPLVADFSSDIASQVVDYRPFSLVYASAQKNLGIAGLTLVIAQRDFLQQARSDLPVMLQYQKFAGYDSMYNTPPTFAWYVTDLVLQWLEQQGGIAAIAKANQSKAALLYSSIDEADFYQNTIHPEWRSPMNVVFQCPNAELDDLFVQQAQHQGLMGLKGHRAVGGLRASLYNAMPYTSVMALVSFMREFMQRYG